MYQTKQKSVMPSAAVAKSCYCICKVFQSNKMNVIKKNTNIVSRKKCDEYYGYKMQ